MSTHVVARSAIDRIQTFSHDPGSDEEVFFFEYGFDATSYPIMSNGKEDIIGATGEEDLVIESAISAAGVVGKNALSRD